MVKISNVLIRFKDWWGKFFAEFLGIRQFRASIVLNLLKKSRDDFRNFKELRCLDEEIKLKYRRKIMIHQVRGNLDSVWSSIYQQQARVIFSIISVLVILAPAIVFYMLSPIPLSFFELFYSTLLVFGVGFLINLFLIIIVTAIMLFIVRSKLMGYTGSMVVFITPILLEIIFWGYIWFQLYQLPEYWSTVVGFASLGGIFSVVAFTILIAIFVFLGLGIDNIYFRKLARQYPDSIVVSRYIRVLSQLEKKQSDWADLSFRKSIIVSIAEIASAINLGLPFILKTGDSLANSWVRQTASEIAMGIRELRKMIVTPKSETYSQLVSRLTQDMRHSLDGSWGELEKVKPKFIDGLQERASALITSLLPLMALVILKYAFVIPDDIFWTVGTALVVIAIVGVSRAIDPYFDNRMRDLKDILDLLRGK